MGMMFAREKRLVGVVRTSLSSSISCQIQKLIEWLRAD
jgi:hypothetical protein